MEIPASSSLLFDGVSVSQRFQQILLLQTSEMNMTDAEVLVLKNVQFNDSGWYSCFVGNNDGYTHRSAWLTVIPGMHAPKFQVCLDGLVRYYCKAVSAED